MGKIGLVAIVTGLTIILYIFMLVIMPIMTQFAASANTTMQATSNMSLYPGAVEGVIAAPLVLWFVPALLWGVIVVGILKRQ